MANRFINYKKLKELQGAAKGGNEQAKNIIDRYMEKNPDMDSIERLIDDYYKGISMPPSPEEPIVAPIEPAENILPEEPSRPDSLPEGDITDDEGLLAEGEAMEEQLEQPIEQPMPVDISADLDRELDGLIDNDDFDDISLSDFLANKKRDANRARKNAEYFKAFDADGRANYLASKKDEYAHSFDGRRKKIERALHDMENAIGLYGNFVTDMPDDESEIDMALVGKAYDELTDDQATMDAFGRSWDEADNEQVKMALQGLVAKYGKKNIAAVLNTIKEDGNAWSAYSNGRIDNAVNNYGKSLDGLLK